MKPVPTSAQEKSISNYKGVRFSRVNPSEGHRSHTGFCNSDQKTFQALPTCTQELKDISLV